MKLDEARIVDSAWAILEERGPSAISMREVAHRLGVTTPALYKHVANREALLKLLERRGWQQFGGALMEGLGARDPLGRLGSIGGHYLDFGLSHPQVYRMLFMDQPTDPLPDDEARPGPGFQLLLDRVAEAQSTGAIPADRDAYALAMLFWASVHGIVSLYVGGGASRVMDRATYTALARRVLKEQIEMLTGPSDS